LHWVISERESAALDGSLRKRFFTDFHSDPILRSREAADKEKLRMKRRGNNEAPFCYSQIIFIRSFSSSAAPLSLFFHVQAKLYRISNLVPALLG
jgi:hypothetical protein